MKIEITDLNGNVTYCKPKANAILAKLGLMGDEIMLDTDDWRGYGWFNGRDVFRARQVIEIGLDLIGEVDFSNYRDIC